MNKKRFTFTGGYFFLAVLILYAGVLVLDAGTACMAAHKAAKIFLRILPILVGVILLTAFINYFLRPARIARHLGRKSGIRGWVWALVGGLLSHGPMYAWYPLLHDLRVQGTRDGLLAAFFASRAVKLPLLPIMIDYFGWIFTLFLCVYILTGAVIQGRLLEMFMPATAANRDLRG
ncbi:MAG: hypothetical protein ACLFSY_10970 [Desulfonatronovibrionaceae bacterium]